MASNANYKSAEGRSLGLRAQIFVVNSNMALVWSGRTGLESYEPRLVFRVWVRKSILRVARGNTTSDLESTQSFGSYRVFPGQL